MNLVPETMEYVLTPMVCPGMYSKKEAPVSKQVTQQFNHYTVHSLTSHNQHERHCNNHCRRIVKDVLIFKGAFQLIYRCMVVTPPT